MRLYCKNISLLILLLFLVIDSNAQELKKYSPEDINKFKFSGYSGIGFAKNNYQGGFGWGGGADFHFKKQVVGVFYDGGHNSEYEHTRDKILKYKSRGFGVFYGLGLWGKYFSCHTGTGIGLINTYYVKRKECTSYNNGAPCYDDLGYNLISIPVVAQISLHGDHVGFFIESVNHFSFPNIDYRVLAGIRIGNLR